MEEIADEIVNDIASRYDLPKDANAKQIELCKKNILIDMQTATRYVLVDASFSNHKAIKAFAKKLLKEINNLNK